MRVFDKCEIKGFIFAILVNDETKEAYEVIWNKRTQEWDTEFNCYTLGIDGFELAGLLDYEEVEKQGYVWVWDKG